VGQIKYTMASPETLAQPENHLQFNYTYPLTFNLKIAKHITEISIAKFGIAKQGYEVANCIPTLPPKSPNSREL
jgi:hypothetical protein